MEIFSAGTSGSSAQAFFSRLKGAGVTAIVDTRRNNISQLAAFSKYPDLPYFARAILDIPYIHELALAPDAALLKSYRSKELSWASYEAAYLNDLESRDVGSALHVELWGERPVLLCSEATPAHCHRRLAADYLLGAWGESVVEQIVHL